MRLKKLRLIDPKSLNGPGIDLRGSKCIFFTNTYLPTLLLPSFDSLRSTLFNRIENR